MYEILDFYFYFLWYEILDWTSTRTRPMKYVYIRIVTENFLLISPMATIFFFFFLLKLWPPYLHQGGGGPHMIVYTKSKAFIVLSRVYCKTNNFFFYIRSRIYMRNNDKKKDLFQDAFSKTFFSLIFLFPFLDFSYSWPLSFFFFIFP